MCSLRSGSLWHCLGVHRDVQKLTVVLLGGHSMSRVVVVFACSSLLAGCAGEQAPLSSFGPNGHGWQTTLRMNATGFYHPVAVALTEDETERLAAAQKTMAGKVLGAIALERVTGRQPDPSRLARVN
jgi:hypothetical protein